MSSVATTPPPGDGESSTIHGTQAGAGGAEGGAAAGARKDDTPAEQDINMQVLAQTMIMICIRGLGKFMLLWSTVVLLGGFVSNLPEADFYYITIISLLQSVRAYNALVDEKYIYISKTLLDNVKKYGNNISNKASQAHPPAAGLAVPPADDNTGSHADPPAAHNTGSQDAPPAAHNTAGRAVPLAAHPPADVPPAADNAASQAHPPAADSTAGRADPPATNNTAGQVYSLIKYVTLWILNSILWILNWILFGLTVCYPLLVCIFLMLVSCVRVKFHSHKQKAGDASEVKMYKAILCFYVITLVQGVLYLPWYGIEFISKYWTVGKTAEKCKFDVSWGEESVRQYLASTKAKCLSDLSAERSLIKFAPGLLDSDSNADLLSGARMVNHFLHEKEKEKKLPVQELIRSSRSRVQKLLMMLAWKQDADKDVRLEAAKIVAHVADELDIAQFPGTLGCISSLIEPRKDNYSLFCSAGETFEKKEDKEKQIQELRERQLIEQGFSILEKLTLDKHNSIQILQDQALLTHIIAWVRSKPFIGQMGGGGDNHWPKILKSCLNVLVRLTSLPEQNASQLHHMIKVQLPIFIDGYAKMPELQVKAIQMFANVFYLDKDEKNKITHPKRIEFLRVIWDLFLSCSDNPDQESFEISRAGEALSMLSANKINSRVLNSLAGGTSEKLDNIIYDEHFSMVYRSLAALIDDRVYTKTMDINDNVTSKEKKLVNVVGLLQGAKKEGDDDEEYFYMLQAALVHTITALINTVTTVQDEDRQTTQREGNAKKVSEQEAKDRERRKTNASLLEQIIQKRLKKGFEKDVKRLIELQSTDAATIGRLEVVRKTAALVKSMIECRILVEDLRRENIVESLKKANNVLSGVDSWEIFNSNLRRGVKYKATLESLINDIEQELQKPAGNTTTPPVVDQGKQPVLPDAQPAPGDDNGKTDN